MGCKYVNCCTPLRQLCCCQLQRLVRELDSVSKQLAVVKRDHEAEVIERVDCENRIKTIQNELLLQKEVHRKVHHLSFIKHLLIFIIFDSCCNKK